MLKMQKLTLRLKVKNGIIFVGQKQGIPKMQKLTLRRNSKNGIIFVEGATRMIDRIMKKEGLL